MTRVGLVSVGLRTAAAFVLVWGCVTAGGAARAAKPPAPIDPAVLAEASAKGEATFWVVLREKAKLDRARGIDDWAARGRFVHDKLKQTAEMSQSGLKSLLKKRGFAFEPFWIVNAIKVSGPVSLVREVAAQPEVEEVAADRDYRIEAPSTAAAKQALQAIEWNIDRIRASLVWSTFGVRGEGVVVANIDTGVQFDHPALVRQYRGNTGSGFSHAYNWFDPSSVCGNPSLAPCDNNGHGTHTMGTMVGDDGAGNQTGVAPAARWIAAKGCEASSCSRTALLASGQWLLAPTDLAGQNPRPDLRPQIVNNSWGGGGGDTFYQATVQAWVSAGIFPAFSNGNSGSACATSGSPGDYSESYSVGAFDAANAIAAFSSRGASAFGAQLKPNIAAPGVSVRSSVPPSSYSSFSGTSMASPHVAGTVALMWSAAAALAGDVAATKALLDGAAIDTADLSCGGTAADNNVWGEGRLDAFAAVEQSPRGPTGTLQGTVTDASSGAAVAGATVDTSGPPSRTTTTDAAGSYSLRLPVGTYTVSGRAFGFVTQSASVVISDGATTVGNLALPRAPAHPVSGQVLDEAGVPVANAKVAILETPIAAAATDGSGRYSFASVPEGTYQVRAAAGRCTDPQTQPLTLAGPATLDFALTSRRDAFGYTCRITTATFTDANSVLPLTGDDASVQIALPFAFPFYGTARSTAWVSTNGFVNFLALGSQYANSAIATAAAPNAAVYGFWDDLLVDTLASVRTELLGTAPNRSFVIEWRNVHFYGDSTRRIRFEIVLHENGQILAQYADLAADAREQGSSATTGIENDAGTTALQYSFNESALETGLAVLYRAGPRTTGAVQGRVTDANDGLGVGGALVRALQNGVEQGRTNAAIDGYYSLALRPGTYTVEASAANYVTGPGPATIDQAEQIVVRDFTLATARGQVSPASLEFVLRAGVTRSRTLTIASTGSAGLAWQLRESPAAPWLSQTPVSGTLPAGSTQSVTVTASTAGLAPGVYQTTLVLDSNSGRRPVIDVPVRLIVPAYDQAVNVGGAAYTDVAGDVWAADHSFDGRWGFSQSGPVVTTTLPIGGTLDGRIYQDARTGRVEYRFEGLPAGTYAVDLRFAELQGLAPGQRVFDVIVQGDTAASLTNHDIAALRGTLAADDRVVFVRVRDRLQISLARRVGEPIVNAIRVTHRPDS
jgi:subtilisin family serine protease